MVQRGRGNIRVCADRYRFLHHDDCSDTKSLAQCHNAFSKHLHNKYMQRTKNTGMYDTCIAYDSDSNPQVIVFIQTNDRLGMTLRVQNFHKFSGGSISQRNLNFFRISLRDPGDASIRVLFRLPWPIKFIINRLVSEYFTAGRTLPPTSFTQCLKLYYSVY